MTESDYLKHILACAWQYDDKPHLLYRAIRFAAEAVEEPNVAQEIVRLMEEAASARTAMSVVRLPEPARVVCGVSHPWLPGVACAMPFDHVARGQDHVGKGYEWEPKEVK